MVVVCVLTACDSARSAPDGATDAAAAEAGSDTGASDAAEACPSEDGLRHHGLTVHGLGSALLENHPVQLALADESGNVLREARSQIEGGTFAVSWPCALSEGAAYRLYYYVDSNADELCCGEPSASVDVAAGEADVALELAQLEAISRDPTACGHFANPIALQPGTYQITSTADGRRHGDVRLLFTRSGNAYLETFVSGCVAGTSCGQSIRGVYNECGFPLCVGRDGTISASRDAVRRGMATSISLTGTVEDGATSLQLHLTGRVTGCCSQEGDVLLERTSLDTRGCE